MSNGLYNIGVWVFSHKWRVLSLWLVAIVIIAGLAVKNQQPFESKISIPGTEAQAALDDLEKQLPAATNASGVIVFAVPEGQSVISKQAEITRTVQDVAKVDGVSRVISPFVGQTISPDGQIAFAQIQVDVPMSEVSESLRSSVMSVIEKDRGNGLRIEARGDFLTEQGAPEIGSGEIAGVVIAAIVLVMTLGSLVAAGMPLVIALTSVIVGILGITTASGFMSISSVTPTLAIMLGLAVGIDYALFIVVKYIKYLQQVVEPREAAGRAIATAGNAVVFAALTVIIALSALSVTGIPFLANMGVFAAVTVAVAALAAITLVPVLLSFAKLQVLSRKVRKESVDTKPVPRQFGQSWIRFVTRRPILIIVTALVLLGALAAPATKLYLGLPDDSTAATDSSARKAYDLLAEGFGPGFNGPLILVASLPAGQLPNELQQTIGTIVANVRSDSNVAQVVPAGVSQDGRTAILQAYPKTGPNTIETRQLIERLRKNAPVIGGDGVRLAVTGSTAVAVDVDKKLADALPLYLLVVVGLSLLILLVVFRSIVVPLKATLGFLLTIAATLGLLVMFFQWGWLEFLEPAPILSFLPIIVTGILFGLAMDYQFFLVSGMHEEYIHAKTSNATQSVVKGYLNGAKVVTAAAIIMISVFGGFIFAHDTIIRSVGFALAVGVFIDAFIVRMTIVPAVMTLFGKHAWWLPKWLAKMLPNLSIEGSEKPAGK